MTEFMDWTSVAKLYGAKGEYSKLYDNQGRAIWQLDDPVWAGSWIIPMGGNGTGGTLTFFRYMHESANGLKLTISITDHTVTVKQLWLAPNDSSPSIDGIQLDQFTWSISVPRKYFATQLDQGRVWLDSTLANNYHTKESFRIAVSSKTLITFATNFFSMPAITRVEEY